MQHIAYERQFQLKVEAVVEQLGRQGITLTPSQMGLFPALDPWRYRWRGEFHVLRSESGARLGFNRARSWTPIAVQDCLIHHRAITEALPELEQIAAAARDATVLHLTVGAGGKELLLATKPARALKEADLSLQERALPAGVNWSNSTTSLEWRGHSYRVSPESFIQVNREMMEQLYGCILTQLGDMGGCTVIDAYAGIGVLAVELAGSGSRVICIEENPAAARMGRLNMELNGVEGEVEFIRASVDDVLSSLLSQHNPDAVLVDPPRAGCSSKVVAALALAGPARIVYVSCDPATLARDLRLLCVSGPYRLSYLAQVDMFPQTWHVECVATLVRE